MNKLKKLEEVAREISKANAKLGCSLEEMCRYVQRWTAYIPPICEEDILIVRMNPALSRFQKWKIERAMRKMIREGERMRRLDPDQELVIPLESAWTERNKVWIRNIYKTRNRKKQRLKRK